MDDLLADFLTETNENLAELDVALVRLERNPQDGETLSLIFRLVHTIKGTCGFLGLPRLERVAHAGENVLGKVRDGAFVITPDVVTAVLTALDVIKFIIAGLAATGQEPAGDDQPLIERLHAISEGRGSTGEIGSPDVAPVAVAAERPAEPFPAPRLAAANAPFAHDPPAAAHPAVAVPAAADRPHALPAAAPMDRPSAKPPIAASGDAQPAHPAGEPPPTGDAHAGPQTIRVGVDVLEDLMTLVSELVLTRNQLLQLARAKDGKTGELGAFSVPLQRLSHITSDLQEGVMKTRMQPIGNAWNKLPRLVRDLARDLDKKIELQMHGAETELDRQVLELIKDPLTHMVRNSGDHGLETPAERRAAGKPESGRITLTAFHEGGHIIIEIADDGRGLPAEKIRAKVLSRGLATEAELAAMSDAQIQRFIFRAGFSTASEITSVSGRGVGMDVVKTNIERIGGTVDLKSVAGQGTSFTIKIPLTLAIVSALIVQAGGERFAIPQLSVVELVRARAAAREGAAADGAMSVIERINGTPVLRLRDQLLPLVSLPDLLELGTADEAQSAGAGEDGGIGGRYIVVAQVGTQTLGIIVDRVFDTEEIVVKPVAPILRHMTMFSGNTILGDGSVIMILDPNGIARATGIVGGDSRARAVDNERAAAETGARHGDERIAMLLFRAAPADVEEKAEPMAVPLALVARLEDIPQERIEMSSGNPVTQYRGRLMPLVPLSGAIDLTRQRQSVLVFADADGGVGREHCMGLIVDEIVDVVEDRVRIELTSTRPGILGTAVIAGRATDVIDTSHWLTQAHRDWFAGSLANDARGARLLVVEDSDFFRQMLVPTLAAAGYDVTAVADAAQALRLRDGGVMFDAIVSDIEMPTMDGNTLARTLRSGGAWRALPIIALSGHARTLDIATARDAGFTDFVEKFERDALLVSLQQCLAARGDARQQAFGSHHPALAA